MFNKKLSPELQAILDEANSRGSLVDGHPDLRRTSPEAERTQYVAIRPFHTVPQGKPDPRGTISFSTIHLWTRQLFGL